MQHLCCTPDFAPDLPIQSSLPIAVVCQPEKLIVSADPAVPAAESDQWLVFEVTDTGFGISQRGLASLFTEYVQVSVVHNSLLVQFCFLCCCIQFNASLLMLHLHRSVALHERVCFVSSCQLLLFFLALA